jgi:hypothetical protein
MSVQQVSISVSTTRWSVPSAQEQTSHGFIFDLYNLISDFLQFNSKVHKYQEQYDPRSILLQLLHAFATALRASRRPVDLGSRYGLSPKLTDRVPVLLNSSRSWVAASSISLCAACRIELLTESRAIVPNSEGIRFPSEPNLQVVVLYFIS